MHASALASDTLRRMDWTVTQRIEFPKALTPCIGVCTLGDDGLCDGCLRTGAEIGAWSSLPDSAKRHLMDTVLPQRERERGVR